MAEIRQEGYQALRDFIQSNWQYIELQDNLDSPVLRLSPTDEKVTWIHNAGESVLKLQIVVTGLDVTLGTTISHSAIYDVATGGLPYSKETFTSFTFESDEDQLTVIHSIQVPSV